MTIRITTWHPDTCNCAIEYLWDDELLEEERTHEKVSVVKPCDKHSGLSERECAVQVRAENWAKNMALKAVQDAAPELTEPVPDSDGVKFKRGKMPAITFDRDRKLQIELASIAVDKQSDIQKTILEVIEQAKTLAESSVEKKE